MEDRILALVAELLRQSWNPHSSRSLDEVRDEIANHLVSEGFQRPEVERILRAVTDDLARRGEEPMGETRARSFRIFSPLEILRLTSQARGYLLQLELQGLLTPRHREQVLESALLCPLPEIGVEEIRYLMQSVLGEEGLVGDDGETVYH